MKGAELVQAIIDRYSEETFMKADGFDDAIIGVDEDKMRLVYSVSKCIEILQKDMSQEEAQEYFDFNVKGSYMGEKTPIWCEDDF